MKKNLKILTVIVSTLLPLLLLVVTVQVTKQKTSYKSKADEAQTVPIIIPGSLLDTGIKAENFTDVDRSSWSWKYIQQISPLGIIPPKTSTEFDPQGLVSRLDMARFLLKTYELITKNSPPVVPTNFTDLTELSQIDQDIVAKIYGLKVTAGTTPTTFSPSDPVNRAQMVTFISSLYKAITGEFPPEAEVPFTDIYDPDLEWSVKYIKKTYNLKITAGTTATTFSPRDNVTREQMATFIFSFMRLFGSSYNTNLAAELSGIKSVVLDFWDPDYYKNGYTNYLRSIIPEFKQTGFNTVWLVYPWAAMNPKPLSTPPVYDDAQFTNLINTLEVLKSNQMKAIIGLDYLGKGWSPEGINYCTWTTDLSSYQAFETYVKEFLKRIENYSDVVYILFFNEGAETCSLNSWDPAQAPQVASIIRPTLGSLPQRLDPTLRNKFKIGFHDWTLLSRKMALGESPVQMPLSYDFYSFNMYEGEEKTDQQIGQEFDSKLTNIKAMYPFTPIFVGEFGATSCNFKSIFNSWSSSASEQARVLNTGLKKIMDLNLGFNIWDWKGKHFVSGGSCPEDRRGEYGITILDTAKDFSVLVSKPARVEIQKLLNPTASAPQCVEQASPTFAQKIIDQNHKLCQSFTSACIPPGWSVVPGITDCKQACTGEPVWLRAPDALCADNNPYPSDCLPDTGPAQLPYYIDDACRLPKIDGGYSWNMVWNDEFNGDKIDETKWRIRGDEEHRDGWWLKEDAYVSANNLVLRTKYDPNNNRYGSGAADSNGKFEHKYGYYEAKIKFAKKEGHWGAFWLNPQMNIVGNNGTDGTEIDIVEKPWINDHIQQTLHWDGYGAEKKNEANSIDWGGISDGYHYFGLNWQPDEYVFYIDGKESWRTKAGGVSQVPQFIYLTDEVGEWIGNINKDELPDYMYIDYVRVYDLAKKCTGEPVWLFEPLPPDVPVGPGEHGGCAINNPYPSDCIPIPKTGNPYEIDYNETCRPARSATPTPTPTPLPVYSPSPEKISTPPLLDGGPQTDSDSYSPEVPSAEQIIELFAKATNIPEVTPVTETTDVINSATQNVFNKITDFYNSVVDFVAKLLVP